MFQLKYHYKYARSEVYEMIPYEKDIMVALILQQIEKEEQEAKKANANI